MASVDLGFADPREWFDTGVRVTKKAIYADDPVEQLAINVVIIVAAMLSSSVGFAPGLIIAMVALFFIGVALLRIIIGAAT